MEKHFSGGFEALDIPARIALHHGHQFRFDSPSRSLGGLRKNLVEQKVDDHARNGNIHPDRPGPARDPLVCVKALPQRSRGGHDDQRHDGKRTEQMRDQDREINGPKPRWIEKPGVRGTAACFIL